METGKLVGRGKTAEVYELSKHKVLKLFFSYTGEGLKQYELEVGRTVYDAGAPAPKAYDHVQLMGRNGIIIEHAGEQSMFTRISSRPWAIAAYGRKMARLHARMHNCKTDKLVPQQEVFSSNINISAEALGEKAAQIISYMESLPAGLSICHGDLHPKNIFAMPRGYIAIDWADAYYGNCAADVARTVLILCSPHIPSNSGIVVRLLQRQLRKKLTYHYLKEYIKLTGMSRADINCWMVPVAAARLKENILGERQWLMDIIDNRIQLLA